MKVNVIGEVFYEYYINDAQETLGGVIHSTRVFPFFSDIDVELSYIAPKYLNELVNLEKETNKICCSKMIYETQTSNVIAVLDNVEAILNKQYYFSTQKGSWNKVDTINVDVDALLIFPSFNENITNEIFAEVQNFMGDIFLDLNYVPNWIDSIKKFNKENLYLFVSIDKNNEAFIEDLIKSKHYKELVVKMNRGGSIIFSDDKKIPIECYIEKNHRSIGIGDVFAASYMINTLKGIDLEKKGASSSYISSVYSIHHANSFINYTNDIHSISKPGIFSDWFNRPTLQIYLAGPDFHYNISHFDKLESQLSSHNFSVSRPIKLNGEITSEADEEQRKVTYYKDLELINESDICIAFLLENDQGTLVEIGMFNAYKKDVILYDPNRILNNMFLENSCKYIAKDVDELLYYLYCLHGMMNNA